MSKDRRRVEWLDVENKHITSVCDNYYISVYFQHIAAILKKTQKPTEKV